MEAVGPLLVQKFRMSLKKDNPGNAALCVKQRRKCDKNTLECFNVFVRIRNKKTLSKKKARLLLDTSAKCPPEDVVREKKKKKKKNFEQKRIHSIPVFSLLFVVGGDRRFYRCCFYRCAGNHKRANGRRNESA